MFKNIVIIGTGYVGIPVAVMFANKGFNVVGINRTKEKVDLINKGVCPIEGDEPNLPELLAKAIKEETYGYYRLFSMQKCRCNFNLCRNSI